MSSLHRRNGTNWLALLLIFVLSLASVNAARDTANKARIISDESAIPLVRRQSVGSSCAGYEGQWNCMTDSFQRCGSGQWSVVEQCAAGTQCSPSGLTYEFHVDFANGYIGAAPPPTTSGGGKPTAGAASRALFAGQGGLLTNCLFLAALAGFVVQLARLW